MLVQLPAKLSHTPIFLCLSARIFRRKKMKILPLGARETAGADVIPMEREGSRRYAKKVMYLGVIACPEEDHILTARSILLG